MILMSFKRKTKFCPGPLNIKHLASNKQEESALGAR